ncbi:12316_t:CDS:2, partial [Entrophospora sp. SA101]
KSSNSFNNYQNYTNIQTINTEPDIFNLDQFPQLTHRDSFVLKNTHLFNNNDNNSSTFPSFTASKISSSLSLSSSKPQRLAKKAVKYLETADRYSR